MSLPSRFEIRRFNYERANGTYEVVKVGAGKCTTERIVPPAGERHAFYVDRWSCNVEVCVSPTGRSVRVFVDGDEVTA